VIRSSRGVLPLRGLAAMAVAALIPAIAGCEAGFNAPTQQWHQPTPGASAVVHHTMRINNMFVLGPTPGFVLPAGASAGVFLALNNSGAPDRLISITAPGFAASVQVPAGGISIGRQQSLLLTGPAPQVVLQHLVRALHGGQWVLVHMDFQSAGPVTLHVPVVPRANYYTSYSPAPRPTPSLFLTPTASLVPVAPTPTPTA